MTGMGDMLGTPETNIDSILTFPIPFLKRFVSIAKTTSYAKDQPRFIVILSSNQTFRLVRPYSRIRS